VALPLEGECFASRFPHWPVCRTPYPVSRFFSFSFYLPPSLPPLFVPWSCPFFCSENFTRRLSKLPLPFSLRISMFSFFSQAIPPPGESSSIWRKVRFPTVFPPVHFSPVCTFPGRNLAVAFHSSHECLPSGLPIRDLGSFFLHTTNNFPRSFSRAVLAFLRSNRSVSPPVCHSWPTSALLLARPLNPAFLDLFF